MSPMGALHGRAWLSVQAAPQLPETGLWGEPYGHNVSGQTNGAGGIPVLPLPSGSSGRRRAQGPASRRLFRHLGVGAMEAPRPQACGRMRIGLWQGPQQSPGCGEEAGGRDTGSQESRLLGRKAFLGLRRLEEGSSSPPWVRADRPGGALPSPLQSQSWGSGGPGVTCPPAGVQGRAFRSSGGTLGGWPCHLFPSSGSWPMSLTCPPETCKIADLSP